MFRFNWGNLIFFLEFFPFFIILLTYSVSATVTCLNFVLASQTEKLISGLVVPATRFNCFSAFLCDVSSSLGNRLFFSLNLSFYNLISEIQSVYLFWLMVKLNHPSVLVVCPGMWKLFFLWAKQEIVLRIIDNIDFKVSFTSSNHFVNMSSKYVDRFMVFFAVE